MMRLCISVYRQLSTILTACCSEDYVKAVKRIHEILDEKLSGEHA